VRELAAASPEAARAVLGLYRAYQATRATADDLSSQPARRRVPACARRHACVLAHPSEEVSDYLQRASNYFPELEAAAEELAARARLTATTCTRAWSPPRPGPRRLGADRPLGGDEGRACAGTIRAQVLMLSELLPTRSRTFQLAHQIAIVTLREVFERHVADGRFASTEARVLARSRSANYFAGAVLMPYAAFHQAARNERYDIDVLGRRFRSASSRSASADHAAPAGREGVPFHMIRLDVAGHISKRFSASGIRFARFSGVCPRVGTCSARS